MAFGPRVMCEAEVQARGGKCGSSTTKGTGYLVIATIGSRDWYHTTHGRKIEQAANLGEHHDRIAIIGEDHWISMLDL